MDISCDYNTVATDLIGSHAIGDYARGIDLACQHGLGDVLFKEIDDFLSKNCDIDSKYTFDFSLVTHITNGICAHNNNQLFNMLMYPDNEFASYISNGPIWHLMGLWYNNDVVIKHFNCSLEDDIDAFYIVAQHCISFPPSAVHWMMNHFKSINWRRMRNTTIFWCHDECIDLYRRIRDTFYNFFARGFAMDILSCAEPYIDFAGAVRYASFLEQYEVIRFLVKCSKEDRRDFFQKYVLGRGINIHSYQHVIETINPSSIDIYCNYTDQTKHVTRQEFLEIEKCFDIAYGYEDIKFIICHNIDILGRIDLSEFVRTMNKLLEEQEKSLLHPLYYETYEKMPLLCKDTHNQRKWIDIISNENIHKRFSADLLDHLSLGLFKSWLLPDYASTNKHMPWVLRYKHVLSHKKFEFTLFKCFEMCNDHKLKRTCLEFAIQEERWDAIAMLIKHFTLEEICKIEPTMSSFISTNREWIVACRMNETIYNRTHVYGSLNKNFWDYYDNADQLEILIDAGLITNFSHVSDCTPTEKVNMINEMKNATKRGATAKKYMERIQTKIVHVYQ